MKVQHLPWSFSENKRQWFCSDCKIKTAAQVTCFISTREGRLSGEASVELEPHVPFMSTSPHDPITSQRSCLLMYHYLGDYVLINKFWATQTFRPKYIRNSNNSTAKNPENNRLSNTGKNLNRHFSNDGQ